MVDEPQNQFDVNSWEECEQKINEIEGLYPNSHGHLLFRGQGNSDWPLATTLERRNGTHRWTFFDYFGLITVIKPATETFTGEAWGLPSQAELNKWAESPDALRMGNDLPGYSYLANLRHHGFPSPLLDWTASQYVAAYFAFCRAAGDRVSIYVYSEMPNNFKTHGVSVAPAAPSPPTIKLLGRYVKTHRRHFIQQSSYTICCRYENQWIFEPHQKVFDMNNPAQDLLWKISIPASERLKVLRLLDRTNINAFSLFDNQEGLMEMLAVREIDLNPRFS